ncbi:MAG: 4-(cytidine 5'-diphospho)-2-C-methyl-D-erythritol kinase [Candidatus Bipolaricaulaceae bacterium]
MARLRVLAYAKLNLTLRVVGRRPDGYHLLESLMTAVELADLLELRPRPTAVRLAGRRGPCPPEENLAVRAAELLRSSTGVDAGVEITLEKNIPPGAGLGGGSADAAAVLAALNRLWGLNLGTGQLQRLGASLGADVPFFLGPSPAWAEGIGDALTTAVTPLPAAFLVLVPPFACPTGEVYRTYDQLGLPLSSSGPSPQGLCLHNDLWPAACRVRPALSRYRARLEAVCEDALGVGMTGSGSALFAAFADRAAALAAGRRLRTGGRTFVAAPVGCGYKLLP